MGRANPTASGLQYEGSSSQTQHQPFIFQEHEKTKKIKMAEITEEQFQALNDQADAEAALKAKLEEENVALGEEIAALEADLAVLKAASADADGTKAALAKKKADLEAKIADLEKEFDVEKKMLKHDLEVTRERLQKEIAGLQKKLDKAVMDLGLLEFRVATAEQEKITLDQSIQAHKAELTNIVNKTRDELTAAKETAHTLQRQAIDSSRSWPSSTLSKGERRSMTPLYNAMSLGGFRIAPGVRRAGISWRFLSPPFRDALLFSWEFFVNSIFLIWG